MSRQRRKAWAQEERTMRAVLIPISLAILFVAAGTPAHSQAFADLKSAAVDYSKADREPAKPCTAMGSFTAKDLVEITASEIPATAAAPGHCRVSGMLAPEIAFEVS